MFNVGPSFYGSTDIEVIQYFTTTIYPIITEEVLYVGLPVIQDSPYSRLNLVPEPNDSMNVGLPALVGGSLDVTIVYQNYTQYQETINVGLPALVGGSLDETIVYKNYNNAIDSMNVGLPALVGGSLEVTVVYVDYTPYQETMNVGLPALVGGSLT